jgi:methylphosphotriester-DNA--protein-cysteine methyltransferase
LFGGNTRMKIYGRLDCPSALRAIKRGPTYARSRVFFADEASALAAGFRPCGVCMRTVMGNGKQPNRRTICRHVQTPNNPPTNRAKKAKEIPGQKS